MTARRNKTGAHFNNGPETNRSLQPVNFVLPRRQTETIRALLGQGLSDSTKHAYRQDLAYFWSWATATSGLTESYPVSVDLVLQFIADHLGEMDPSAEEKLVNTGVKAGMGRHSLATVKRRLATLSIAHEVRAVENPVKHKFVRQVLRNAGRLPDNAQKQKKAITLDVLERMLKTCRNGLRGTRDKALLLTAFASGGRRRSEVSGMLAEDVIRTEDGFVIHIRRSKTDQRGKGMEVPVFGQAAIALRKWLTASGITEGQLFRGITNHNTLTKGLTGKQISRIVKWRLEKAGYDSREYGAHSLRSGFITESGRQGISIGDAMALSGHKNLATALRYYRPGELAQNPAARLTDGRVTDIRRGRR